MEENMQVPTVGQKMVGLSFNPSGSPEVQEIKEAFAKTIDLLHEKYHAASTPMKQSIIEDAITAAVTAQMWAVKAVTFEEGK